MRAVEHDVERPAWIWQAAGGSVLLGVGGQLLFRRFGQAQSGAHWPRLDELVWPAEAHWLGGAIFCYLTAVVLWVKVLQHLPLSRAYPLQSLAYPLVYLGAIGWLDEALTLNRGLGTLLVCAGVTLSVHGRRA